MGTTADQICKEIADLGANLVNSISDTHQTLYSEIKRTQDRMAMAEAQLRGRARTANEVTAQVFASGHFEALLKRLEAIERAMLDLGRRMLELETARAKDEDTETNHADDLEW
jgi:hypothetical protein